MPANCDFDLIVIGGGPAGSACALSARELGLDVCVIDGGSSKLCGGMLNAESASALRKLVGEGYLKLLADAEVLREPQRSPLTLEDMDTRLRFSTRPDYINMDRSAFDRWLLGLAETSGARIERSTLATSLRQIGPDGGWEVTLREVGPALNARLRTVSAQNLVLATGYRGLGRMVHGYKPVSVPAMLALQVSVPCAEDSRIVAVLSRKHTDFFGWVIPKIGSDGSTQAEIGVGVPAWNPLPGFELIQSMSERYADRVPVRSEIRGCPLTRPGHRNAARPDLLPMALTVGEASGLVSPSSGDGISYALESGRCAAMTLAACGVALSPGNYASALAHYELLIAPLRRRIGRQVVKANVMALTWLRRAAQPVVSLQPMRSILARYGLHMQQA